MLRAFIRKVSLLFIGLPLYSRTSLRGADESSLDTHRSSRPAADTHRRTLVRKTPGRFPDRILPIRTLGTLGHCNTSSLPRGDKPRLRARMGDPEDRKSVV